MSTKSKLLCAISSGVLLSIGWPSIGSAFPILFFALVPLFILERKIAIEQLEGSKSKLFPFVWLSLLVFNVLTTWWVWNASSFGAIMAILLNSLFLAFAFQLAHYTRKKLGNFKGDFALVFFWIGWEYFHLDWDLSWTWLTLGNGLANAPYLIQWYEYSGAFGGSLWILLSNLLVTHWLVKSEQINSKFYQLPGIIFSIKWLFVLIIPAIISLWIFSHYEEPNNPIEIVVVQPNIDPYNEKFGGLSSVQQVEKMFALAEQKVTSTTEFVIFPETAIPQSFDEEEFIYLDEYSIINSFCKNHPNTQVIIGASTFVVYGPNDKVQATTRTTDEGVRYDYCNTAISLNYNSEPAYYHKSKMVPGVEKMPFPGFFQYFQSFAFNLGGTTGSLGGQENRTVFHSINQTPVAPIICYESVYGEFVGDYVEEGAELLFIITNDGWWGNTPGYKQHFLYAQLRAIEQRRSIARSANTGISGFINQKGETINKSDWWAPTAMRANINANTNRTFYSLYGDIVGRVSLAFGILLLVFAISRGLMNKNK